MDNQSLKSKESNVGLVKKVFEYTSYFFGAAFLCGFLVWNVYLYGLGFKEDDILQIRFIFTGICFLIISTPVIVLSVYINKKINPKNIFWKFFRDYVCVLLIVIYLISYISFLFARIPIALGGGRPRGLAIITDTTNLDFLSKFGIPKGESSETQTANICIAYENEKIIVILLGDRVMQIKKEGFLGFVSLPGDSVSLNRECSQVANFWIKRSFMFEFMTDQKIKDKILSEESLNDNDVCSG